MKLYKLIRLEDESGVSGTGHVADIVDFENGHVVMSWCPVDSKFGVNSLNVYRNIKELIQIHGHDGKTKVVDAEQKEVRDLCIMPKPDGSFNIPGRGEVFSFSLPEDWIEPIDISDHVEIEGNIYRVNGIEFGSYDRKQTSLVVTKIA